MTLPENIKNKIPIFTWIVGYCKDKRLIYYLTPKLKLNF